MPAFIVATVEILDRAAFAEYGKSVAGLSERFGGEAIVKGKVGAWLEGEGPVGERVVVTRFPDGDAARAYIGSDEYQSAAARRSDAARVVMRLIEVE